MCVSMAINDRRHYLKSNKNVQSNEDYSGVYGTIGVDFGHCWFGYGERERRGRVCLERQEVIVQCERPVANLKKKIHFRFKM